MLIKEDRHSESARLIAAIIHSFLTLTYLPACRYDSTTAQYRHNGSNQDVSGNQTDGEEQG